MRYLLMFIVFTTACATSRTEVPKAGTKPVLHAPVPVQKQLSNGLTLFFVPIESAPVVTTHITLKTGSALDPQVLPGLAAFTGAMLKQGTPTRNAKAIADAVENEGASLNISTDEDVTEISTTVLRDNLPQVLDVMADVLLHPFFAKDEVERIRLQHSAVLEEIKNDPEQMADVLFRQTLYGNHPYAHAVIGTEESLQKISQKDLQSYYQDYFVPKNAVLVMVGNFRPEEMLQTLEKLFGNWQNSPTKAPDIGNAKELTAPQVVLFDREGAPQTQLRIGHLGVERSNNDYYALVMCNAVLGGLFNSRINMNLREDKGYTYGARSTFDFMRAAGPFVVSTGVRTDVTEAAIKEVLKEIALMSEKGVLPQELQNAKNRYTLSLPGYWQTTRSIANLMSNIFVFNLDLNYYQNLPGNIEKITLEDVSRVAKQYLRADKLLITAVGDKRFIEPSLTDLNYAPVNMIR